MACWALQWNQKSNDSKSQEASRKLWIFNSLALPQEGKCGAQMLWSPRISSIKDRPLLGSYIDGICGKSSYSKEYLGHDLLTYWSQ